MLATDNRLRPLIAKYKELITTLDCALTGKPFRDCLHTFRNSGADSPEKLLTRDVYYLSDGGYSRIAWGDERQGVFLTSNSREEVKQAWDRCRELVADLDRLLNEYYQLRTGNE